MHGLDPIIMSKKQPSVIYGAQYLHKPIPGLSSQRPDGNIRTLRVGRPELYAKRVYGNGQHVTSWTKVRALAPAWNLRETYERAWQKYKDNIADMTVSPTDVADLTSEFDLVISTIPLWSICLLPNEHRFNSVSILVKKDVHLRRPIAKEEHWVIYNGTNQHDWYRASVIFGCSSIEARSHPKLVNQAGWESGFKVVDTNCDCHPNIVRAGRMGLWTRGVLTHHAFETTLGAIAEQFGAMSPGSWTDHSAGSV